MSEERRGVHQIRHELTSWLLGNGGEAWARSMPPSSDDHQIRPELTWEEAGGGEVGGGRRRSFVVPQVESFVP